MHSASTVDPTAMMTLFMRFSDAHEYGRTDDPREMIQTIFDKSNMVYNHLEMLGSFKEVLTYTCNTCNTPHATRQISTCLFLPCIASNNLLTKNEDTMCIISKGDSLKDCFSNKYVIGREEEATVNDYKC